MNAPKQFLRIRDVQARVGMSRTAIYREMAAGLFPKQIVIGANAVAWDSDEIGQWQQAKIEASRGAYEASKAAP